MKYMSIWLLFTRKLSIFIFVQYRNIFEFLLHNSLYLTNNNNNNIYT